MRRFGAFDRPAIALGLLGLAVGPGAPAVAGHGAIPDLPPDAASLLVGWTVEPPVILGLLAAVIVWRWIGARVRARHPGKTVPRRRTAAFLGGLAAIALALMGGVARYDTALFSVHMVQHLLLVVAAAPLLALAAPVTQLLRAVSPAGRRIVLRVLRSPPVAVLAHPVTAWSLFTGVMWASHFSALFDAALEDPLLHDLEHGLFLAAGLLFWWPAVGLDPAPHRPGHGGRLLYLAAQMPPNSFLAMAILFAPAPLYPHYATLGAPWGIDALDDQRLAAGLMWFVGDTVFLAALLAVLAGWLRREEHGTIAADRRADAARKALASRADALAGRGSVGQPPPDGSGDASNSR